MKLIATVLAIFTCLNFSSCVIHQVYAQINPSIAPSSIISDSLQNIWNNEVAAFGAEGGIIGIHVPDLWTWKGATGNARISPNIAADTSFSFRIASLSKSYIAAALLKLQEQSVLDLDDNIGLYLNSALFNTIPNGSGINIRQLLNHTSGIAEYLGSPGHTAAIFTLGLNHQFTPEQLVGYGVANSPLFPPGTSWAYSNTNYVLAALVIEGATAGTYETFIQNTLLVPFALTETYFPLTNTLPGNYMGSYTDLDNNGTKDDFSVFSPSNTFGSGPLVSKLGEVLKWLELLETGQILNNASLSEMKSWINSNIPDVDYGLGLGEYNNGMYTSIGHTGSIFNTSNMQHLPTEDYYIVFNVTDMNFPAYTLTDKIHQYLGPLLDSCRNFHPLLAEPLTTGLNPGQSINLQASVGNNYSYQWSMNGQIINGATSANFQTGNPGNYRVLITDGMGCQRQTQEITLTDCQNYQISILPDQSSLEVCPLNQVDLSAGSPADSINWYDQNGNVLELASNTFSFLALADSSIIMIATDTAGCQYSDTITLTLANIPPVNLGPDQQLCTGELVILEVGMSTDSVNWRDLSGNLIQANSNNYQFMVSNPIFIEAELWHACGIEKDTVQFSLNTPTSIELGPDLTVCENDTIRLLADYHADSINWYDENQQLILADSDEFLFFADQSRSMIAEAIGPCGTVYDTIQFTVTNQATLDLGPDLYACEGSILSLQAGSSVDTVSWFDLSGSILQQHSNSFDFSVIRDDTFVVSLNSSCGIARDTIAIFALPPPSIQLGPDTSYALGDTVVLSPVLEPGTQLNWFDISGNLLAATNDYSFIFNGEISLIAIAELNGCTSTDTVRLSVATGIDPTWNPLVTLFPNPVDDYLQIRAVWDQPMRINLKIIDMNGQVMLQKNQAVDNQIEWEFSVNHLSSGLYLIMLESPQGLLTRKFKIE